MGMRKSTRQELRKLREIARECLEGKRCFFCKELLIPEDGNHYAHGDGEGSPFDVDFKKYTIHHKNGDHDDNRKRNRKWSHTKCHKSFHLTLRHKQNRKLKKAA